MVQRPNMAILAGQLLETHDGPPRLVDKPVDYQTLVMQFIRNIALDDMEAIAALITDDCELRIPSVPIFFPVRYARGREQVIEALRKNFPEVQDQQHEIIAMVEDAERCVIILRERGKTRLNLSYDAYCAFVFQFVDGRIASMLEFGAPTQV